MIELNNTTANIRRIANTPESELGEGGPAIIFDVPAELEYADTDIDEVMWTGDEIMIWYQPEESGYREYLSLYSEERDGTIVVDGYGPGIISAEGVFKTRTEAPHSKTLKPIYEWLMSEGVEFADLEQVASSQ